MTKLTDESVRAMLDGATPGAWRADGEPWNRVVWSSADNRVCFMAHSNGLNDERDTATSNLVAAAPDLARALLDARAELAQARAELARVRADAELAVAEAIRQGDLIRRMDAIQACQVGPSDEWSRSTKSGYEQAATDCARNILRIEPPAPADALAEVQRLRETVEALVVVLDRNEKKGPIPDVEMMFCWLAAQDVRAAFRKIAQKGEAT